MTKFSTALIANGEERQWLLNVVLANSKLVQNIPKTELMME